MPLKQDIQAALAKGADEYTLHSLIVDYFVTANPKNLSFTRNGRWIKIVDIWKFAGSLAVRLEIRNKNANGAVLVAANDPIKNPWLIQGLFFEVPDQVIPNPDYDANAMKMAPMPDGTLAPVPDWDRRQPTKVLTVKEDIRAAFLHMLDDYLKHVLP